jgi:protein transport protein SEC24
MALVPGNPTLKQRSHLPLGLVVRPFAKPPAGAAPLPVINHGGMVLRCGLGTCRAYINPYVTFIDGGASWRCNFCGRNNEVPSPYFAPLDSNGVRTDIASRPELLTGAYDIDAPEDYLAGKNRPPMPPTFVFLIDVSQQAQRSGALSVIAKTIDQSLDSLYGRESKRARVSIVTFDSEVHVYELRADAQHPRLHVVTNAEDFHLKEVQPPAGATGRVATPSLATMLAQARLPVPDELAVSLDDCRAQISQLLQELPTMHATSADQESAFGLALCVCAKIIQTYGGKIMSFLSGLPTVPPGRLLNREAASVRKTIDEELPLYKAQSPWFKWLALTFSRSHISVDVYLLTGQQYTDVATLNDLPIYTGGELHYLPAASAEKLSATIERSLQRPSAWESVLRVRASRYVSITDIFGNFSLRQNDLIVLPHVSCDISLTFELAIDDVELPFRAVYVQTGLLYTSAFGERRIRVLTLPLHVTHDTRALFESCNVNATMNLLAKQAVAATISGGLTKARTNVMTRVVNILRSYRSLAGNANAYDYGVLGPLSVMVLGLIKSSAFKGELSRPDARCAALYRIMAMGVTELESYVRPRLLPVHAMAATAGGPVTTPGAGPDEIELPAEQGLTIEHVTSDGVYLVDNGIDILLRVGRAAAPELLTDLFGMADISAYPGRVLRLREPAAGDTVSHVARLKSIITFLRRLSPYAQDVHIVKEDEPEDQWFRNSMIEDGVLGFSLAGLASHIVRG